MKRIEKKHPQELAVALKQWHDALRRFDAASEDEVRIIALEVEAAKQRYIYLLNKQRAEVKNC